MADARKRVAVLISGRGSNMAALIAAASQESFPAEIALVLSNRADAAGLDHARAQGVSATAVDRRKYASKAEMEARFDAALREAGIELICLAGYMQLLSATFVKAWRDRMLNIHPSLLPLFPGLDTHARALQAGVKLHGATVHFVRTEMDTGPIVAQGAVPVIPGDTPDTLAARVLEVEHRLYPMALGLVASGRVTVTGDIVQIDGAPADPNAAILSPPDQG
jgi:phosphoribosylglycinamide formyltransferase-1